MNDFDRLVVEESIRSRVGEPDAVTRVGRRGRTPMTVFVDIAEGASDERLDLFWVDGGIPGHFTLRGGEALSVIFHSRQVELCAHLRTLTLDDALDRLRSDLFEGAALRIIAEFLLQRGHIDQALQTLAKSRRVQSGVFLVEPQIAQLEHLPYDERYLVEWFFGLGHEIGHAAGADFRKATGAVGALSPRRISDLIDRIVDARFGRQARATLKRIIRQGDRGELPRSHASAGVILEEALADLFSVVCMSQVWARVCAGSTGRELRPDLLLTEVLVSMSSVMTIEQCRVLAGWFSSTQGEVEAQPLMLTGVALQARMNLLVRVLADEEARDLLRKPFPASGVFRGVRPAVFTGVMEALEARSGELSRGMERARKFLSSPEMRDTELFYGYVDEVARDRVIGQDALRFLAVARSQRAASPELSLLEQAAARHAPRIQRRGEPA